MFGLSIHESAKKLLESMLFDKKYYGSKLPESTNATVNHYLVHSKSTIIDPHPLFDTGFYLKQLSPAELGAQCPLLHYIERGSLEDKDPHILFQSKFYRAQNIELEENETLLGHYLRIGARTGINPNEYFDSEYYTKQVPSLKGSNTNPLLHYVLEGAKVGLNPSEKFHTEYYRQQNPDLAYCKQNPLAHYLTVGRAEGRAHQSLVATFFSKKKSPTSNIDESETATPIQGTGSDTNEEAATPLQIQFQQLREIEPLLPPVQALTWLKEMRKPTHSDAGAAYFELIKQIKKPFSHLFVMPWLVHGGAERVTVNMLSLVAEQLGSAAPLFLAIESTDVSAKKWLPEGVRLLVLDQIYPGLTNEQKELVLLRFILQSRPKSVLNTNSLVCWNIFKNYGRQIAAVTKSAACLFNHGYDENNVPVGFGIQHLNSSIDNLTYLFCDTEQFRQKLIDRFAFDATTRDKLIVSYTPLMLEKSQIRRPRTSTVSRKQIIWASRLSQGKRPDILSKIAKRFPEIDFQVWGKSDLGEDQMSQLKAISNITINGEYQNFNRIPSDHASLFLYTTESDGLPVVILEAVAAGLPIVAPAIGGIPEMISETTGWLIDQFDDIDSYCNAIQEVLQSPDMATSRTIAAQDLVKRRHLWPAYREQIQALGGFWGNKK